MNDSQKIPEILKHGSAWLRADFHLHTRADKEFSYKGEESRFVSDYVEGLKKSGIRIGVIANHNKFDMGEFSALRKKARKEDIFLLPGVELSTSEGKGGIHTIIVFDDKWLENGNDHISPFITRMFPGKAEVEYQNENGRSDKNLLQLQEALERESKDCFLIFAHVEQDRGLWKEMSGGRLSDFATDTYAGVRKRALGFQKVRTRDERAKVQSRLGRWYPAEVEGSDCKSVEDIGKGRAGYIKLGAFSFDALKYALMDKDARVAPEPKKHTHSHIRSMKFTGGTLDGKEILFSPELNTFIGIRGSGKSSVLEVLRYVLDIPFGDRSGDRQYKENLVGFTMGSGGKVEVEAADRFGQRYTVRRIFGERFLEVLMDGVLQPGVSIRETVLSKPIYFGQKDLSNTGEGFERDLVEKLLGSKLDDVRRKIAAQEQSVADAVEQMIRLTSVHEQIEEQRKIKQDTEHQLKFYKEHGVEEKLQKRLDFDADERVMKKGIGFAQAFVSDLENLLAQHEDDLRNLVGYSSKHNSPLFESFFSHFATFVSAVDNLKNKLPEFQDAGRGLSGCLASLNQARKNMTEEFAEIERKLASELKKNGTQNISSDEFLKLKKRLASAEQIIEEAQKQGDRIKASHDALSAELSKLSELRRREFVLIKEALDKVGAEGASIWIESDYRGDKTAFLAFMKSIFKGSNVREVTYQKLCEKYTDFIAIYREIETARHDFGTNPQVLLDLFMKHLKTLLTFQVPNKFTIYYREKPLRQHSLGQRASALILFILSQKENDVIIIDQPEDDLDNQTIYEDVIKLILQLKPGVQFVFATHNPNIPVLGDAELVHACSFTDAQISVESASVDWSPMQTKIVDIMEGGEEAFRRRKEIYQIWKP